MKATDYILLTRSLLFLTGQGASGFTCGSRSTSSFSVKLLDSAEPLEIFKVTLRTQEEERRRISESLHNGLGQLLYGIKISMNDLTPDQALQSDESYIASKHYTRN